MKKSIRTMLLAPVLLALIVTACGNKATPTASPTNEPLSTETPIPTVTNDPDPCAPENIQASVQEIHKYMREFDDGSSLAASIPADQLPDTISNLQRIRREAEDQATPTCLTALKTYQISHMNVVIGTLINLIGYANGKVSREVIDQGIALARQEHDKYTIELARVLGLTMVPAQTLDQPTATPSP